MVSSENRFFSWSTWTSSNEKRGPWLWTGYIGDYTAQLFRDYFINHELRIPSLNNQDFNGKSPASCFFFVFFSHVFTIQVFWSCVRLLASTPFKALAMLCQPSSHLPSLGLEEKNVKHFSGSNGSKRVGSVGREKKTCLEPEGHLFINGWLSIGWWFQIITYKMVGTHHFHPWKTGCLGYQVGPRGHRWWQLKYFLFSPLSLGKWSNLTSIFFKGVETTN